MDLRGDERCLRGGVTGESATSRIRRPRLMVWVDLHRRCEDIVWIRTNTNAAGPVSLIQPA